jgi:hypothetical protein
VRGVINGARPLVAVVAWRKGGEVDARGTGRLGRAAGGAVARCGRTAGVRPTVPRVGAHRGERRRRRGAHAGLRAGGRGSGAVRHRATARAARAGCGSSGRRDVAARPCACKQRAARRAAWHVVHARARTGHGQPGTGGVRAREGRETAGSWRGGVRPGARAGVRQEGGGGEKKGRMERKRGKREKEIGGKRERKRRGREKCRRRLWR